MCTSCLENGSSNYQCTVNKGLILPQYMLLLCPWPHSMVKRASEQTHKSFCSIFSHVECICQGPEVKRRKRKKKEKEGKKKQNWGLFRTHGIWSFLGERSLIWEPGRRKVEMFQTVQCLQKPHKNLLCSFSLFRDGELPYFTKFLRSVFLGNFQQYLLTDRRQKLMGMGYKELF